MLKYSLLVGVATLLTAAPFAESQTAPAPSGSVTVSSPDKRIRLLLSREHGQLTYRVSADGQTVLEPSNLGLRTDGVELGQDVVLGKPQFRAIHEDYPFFGAHRTAHNDANEATVPVESHGERYFADLHVANDGVAVRLRLAAKAARRVEADRSSWVLPGDPALWVDKLDNSYESPYVASTLKQLPPQELGMPVTARLSGGLYVTLTEAAVQDYGDLALKPDATGALTGDLYADPQGWSTAQAVVQPWRVTVIARTLTELVNTTLVEDLNPPVVPQLAQADWIRPGRSSWQWLSSGDPREEEQHRWVDWTSQLGFEYYLIDDGWSHWKTPWPSVLETVRYAKAKGVHVWIWTHSKEVWDAEARQAYFRRAAEAGVVGVKIDFPPPASRAVSNWYVDTARDAAAAHLMVDFHGANKPTGMQRTWPNVLTREGLRGHEYHITRYGRVLTAEHDTILPFTRYIAGPGDYTPTVFTSTELQGNTWAHELAQAVIFTSPLLCFGGSPESYLSNPARDVIEAIPPVWDEVRVLPGSEPGKLVAEARRSGTQWFLAVINGGQAQHLDLSLDFLGPGNWKSSLLRDAGDRPDASAREDGEATRSSHISLQLAPRGGFVGWVRR